MRRFSLFIVVALACISVYAQTPSIPGILDPAFTGSKAELPASSGVSVSKSNLLAWYDFANTNDAHGSYNLSQLNSPTYTAGSPNYGSSFGGSNLWTQPSLDGAFSTNGGSSWTWAIRFMANAGAVSGSYVMYGQNGTTAARWLTTTVRGSVASTTQTTTAVGVTNFWYTYVAVYTPTNRNYYLNGTLYGPAANAFSTFGGDIYFGGQNATSADQYNIDYAGFWNRALSTNEVSALSTNTVTYSELQP